LGGIWVVFEWYLSGIWVVFGRYLGGIGMASGWFEVARGGLGDISGDISGDGLGMV
jgi:hypothetical protein